MHKTARDPQKSDEVNPMDVQRDSSGPERSGFTEDSIRSDAMMAESDRLQTRDLERLLSHKDDFVDVACPACDARQPHPLWQKDGFSFVQCGRCETGYVNPQPRPSHLDEYYRTSEHYKFWSGSVFPAAEATRRAHIARPRVTRILEICQRHGLTRPKLLLEVGAGHGTFCAEAKATGRFERVVAIEPAPSNAQACRERGVEVIELPIEQVALTEQSADVLVNFEVIEHLSCPRDFIVACSKTLRPGGLLALSCPNLKGFDVQTLGAASRTVTPEHLNYFHCASLATLLERCDLEVVELLTPGKLDAEIVRKRALAGLLDLTGQPFLKAVLIDEWDRLGGAFQSFLADSMLSSHMWAVARRPL